MTTETLPSRLPLFPLPNAVLFPNVFMPLHIFEPRYCEMIRDAISNERIIGMVLLKAGWNVSFRYQKYRKEFQKDDVVIAGDETPVGTYIELEGKESTITHLARTLGRTTDDYVIASYRQLYVEHCTKTNKPIGNMVFGS